MQDLTKLEYGVQEALKMTDTEFEECAALFSNSYGRYSADSPIRPGENVRMGPAFFEKRFKKQNIYIATVRCHKRLIGQAVYIRRKYKDIGTMTWVMQLVVDADYREHGIGSTLLRSIWGFSNDFAWGLATANPCTVKALESATFRKCTPRVIAENIEYIKRLSDEISFVKENGFLVDNEKSIANTNFYIDNSEFADVSQVMDGWQLGELLPGCEWLAFTFRSQEINPEKYRKHFEEMIEFSEAKLQNAYSRMRMTRHPWARGTQNEVDAILQGIPVKKDSKILDLGCGEGRHSLELAKRGYSVVGVDFSEKHINTARSGSKELPVRFTKRDIRKYRDGENYDVVLCLFDVIGSFPDEKSNVDILKTIVAELKPGGYCAISVMNMELTDKLVPETQKGNVLEQPELLYALPPGDIKQTTGNIFEPKYMVVDRCEKLVYRKEQFMDDDELPAEYVIRDKRYTKMEIEELIRLAGLEVVEGRYVQAGHFDVSLSPIDEKAKEIFLIAQKTN